VKLYKFRPSDPFSPRRELQESFQCSYSSISLRRPRLGLGEIQSRLGEIGSPKRGREETWLVSRAKTRPGEEFCGFERTRVSVRRDGLA